VCKPGAFLLAFGGTRTFHRLACAIEDAGWEIRDCMSWLYGSGFPKSLDISKAINKAAGAERKVVGQTSHPDGRPRNLVAREIGVHEGGQRLNGVGLNITAPATPDAEKWSGWGTALKPAWEPIIVAMKPLEGTFAENAQRHGVAGLNIDGARIEAEPRPLVVSDRRNGNGVYRDGLQGSKMIGETSQGRWPANVLLDEESARQLDEQGGERVVGSGPVNRNGARQMDGWGLDGKTTGMAYGDTGGASRFFYTAKASRSDRGHGNDHPTVKPTDLIKYLCKLTAAPTGGVILDPFAGSGTTLVAAREVGRPCIGIELDEKHCRIVVDRLRQGVLFAPGRESA
jgi:site-specific DNA-methyltransferase (adenine-specific)